MENRLLKKEDISQYEFTKFCEKGTLLEYLGQPVFIIGSGVDLRDDFIVRLIEAYSKSTVNNLS